MGLRKWPHMRSGDLIILNSSQGVIVGMVIKLSGPVMHTNHLCGPELNAVSSILARTTLSQGHVQVSDVNKC